MEGDPKFTATQQIPDVPYHRFAELIGLRGIFVDNPDNLATAWQKALASDRPVVLEVRTDPEVPPLPPHITLKQAKSFMSAALAPDPNEAGMLMGTAKELLSAVLPGQK
jgi:pyruvate dehydrogenase (quinone)